jgi:hypothetical protein
MPYEPPSPPDGVSTSLLDCLKSQSPEDLRRIANYANALAEYRDREDRLSEQDEEDERGRPELDRPEAVPSKATVTTKTINDNRYYYWQWREGEKIKSKYIGPVDAAE